MALVPTLVNKGFQNWLKGTLALLFAKEGLVDFVEIEMKQLQNDILQDVYKQTGIPPGTTCTSCTTANVLQCQTNGFCSKGKKCKEHDPNVPSKKPNQPCPNELCVPLRDAIRKEHRFNTPSWKNTDARRWCFDPFEVSKCYMSPDGYSGKTSIKDTDFNGVLAIIINNKRFQMKMASNISVEPNLCTEARVVGRQIRHTANHLLSDQDLVKYIDDLINLLSDPAYLATDAKAKTAVNNLNQLKNNTLTIHANDITNVLNDTMEHALSDHLVTLSNEETEIIKAVRKHFEENKTDSVEAIGKIVDQKINKLKDVKTKGIEELKAETVQGKQVLLDCNKQVSEDVLLYTRSMSHLKDKGIQELRKEIEKGKQQLDFYGKRVLTKVKEESQVIGESKHGKMKGQKKEKKEKRTLWKRIFGRFKSLESKDRDFEDYSKLNVDKELSRSTSGSAEKLLRLDLVDFYREKYSTIPVSPLVEDDVVPVEEFYVSPPMTAVDIRRPFGNPTRTPVTSFRELFIQDDGSTYKNIYVTADAGIGKTCFSKYICMHWCQAHKALTSLSNKFKPEDIAATQTFDFLFLITMRDIDASMCDLDELIVASLNDNLRRRYHRQLLDEIFAERSCLIILEGMDEWSHPCSCKRPHKDDDIPHRKARSNWTTLTTLRPWKFDVIRPSGMQIDRHVEINILDENSTNQLVINAINLLNKTSVDKSKKTVEDFNRAISLINLGEVQHVPFIYLQCVCLWFDGKKIGESKCEIFTNVVELTLNRGTMKIQSGSAPVSVQAGREFSVPKCMFEKPYCMQNLALLLKLGELAFFALFDVENIQRLVLDVTFARKYLEPEELDYCLKLGLLSQNKVYGPVSQKISNVSFQHKTLQEFFTAFYIQANLEYTTAGRTKVQEIILQKCTSLSTILEVSNVLIFLSGFRPQAYSEISHKIKDIVSSEKITCEYRAKTYTKPDIHVSNYDILLKYQTLQKDCTREMEMSGEEYEPLPLQDILIDNKTKHEEYMSALQTIIHDNLGSLKSLSIQQCQTTAEVTQILETLDLHNIHSLDKLSLAAVARQPDVEQLLTQSMNTLRCLSLSHVNWKQGICYSSITTLSERCKETILNMPLLQALRLTSLSLTHNQLNKVASFITSLVKMTEIHIDYIVCSDHKMCPGVVLDMSRHVNVKYIGLGRVPVSKLHVNTDHLEECLIGELSSSVTTHCFTSLQAAQNLKTLWLSRLNDVALSSIIHIIPAILRLEQLYIRYVYLDDRRISLSTEMTKLEYIDLWDVSMACSCLWELVKTVKNLGQSVTVQMYVCRVTPESDYQNVIRELRKSEAFTVIQHGSDVYGNSVFKFQTVK